MTEREPYKFEVHVFKKRFKRLPFEACVHCGLVFLRNERTKWCVQRGCNCEDHPAYNSVMRREV